jgi:hypothetical protein
MTYANFTTQVDAQGAKLSTIETFTFPNIKRMVVVTYKDTKQVFAGLADCVVYPPLFIDAPKADGLPVFEPGN